MNENTLLTDELKTLCHLNSISIDLVADLIQSEKNNSWKKWTAHKSLLEKQIQTYLTK